MTKTTHLHAHPNKPSNSPRKVAAATMIGTTIEYFDNYIYATAAVLVFHQQFFDHSNEKTAQIAALWTLGLNILARPIGAALFGHYGDRLGRKNALVISLMLMGICTAVIGILPTYADIGITATILLFVCRAGQGIGLGGEWGGAVLVATENAPVGKRGLYAMFPQLGAAIGLMLANLVFLLLTLGLGQQAVMDWAWRIPFIGSALLVAVGLYVRLNLYESPVFAAAKQQQKLTAFPLKQLIRQHKKPFWVATLIAIIGYVQFYIVVVFGQVYAKSLDTLSAHGHTQGLGLPAAVFSELLTVHALSFGLGIVLAGYLCDVVGRRQVLTVSTLLIGVFGLCMPQLLTHDHLAWFVGLGMVLLGTNFGPMAVILPEIFSTEVRYSGAALSFTVAGVLGASVATLIALQLNEHFGLLGVGVYVAINAVLSLAGLALAPKTEGVLLSET